MNRIVQLCGIGAPLSWLLVPIMAIPASRGTDGGWSGLHAMFLALAIVLLIHVAGLLGLLIVFSVRIWKREKVGKGLGLALLYFALMIGGFMLGSGPQEFWHDASALVSGLFEEQR